ncbi:MAG: STAS/SEC14 domain-containing protein, partial [Desulfobulbales bacterium]
MLSGRSVKTITNNGKDVVVSNISKCKKNYAVEVIEMLEMLDVGDDKIIAYRLGGKITEEEMTSVLDIFREKIDKGKKLIVYQEVESIGGAELDAMVKKFNFFK